MSIFMILWSLFSYFCNNLVQSTYQPHSKHICCKPVWLCSQYSQPKSSGLMMFVCKLVAKVGVILMGYLDGIRTNVALSSLHSMGHGHSHAKS